MDRSIFGNEPYMWQWLHNLISFITLHQKRESIDIIELKCAGSRDAELYRCHQSIVWVIIVTTLNTILHVTEGDCRAYSAPSHNNQDKVIVNWTPKNSEILIKIGNF